MRRSYRTPSISSSSTSSAEVPSQKYICTACNIPVPLLERADHEASKRHLSSPMTCSLCNVRYAKSLHSLHTAGKRHKAHLGEELVPTIIWDQPKTTPAAPKRLGDGIGMIRLVPAATQAIEPVLWKCGVCLVTMTLEMRVEHQGTECVPLYLQTWNIAKAKTAAVKKAKAKKKERQGKIESGRKKKGSWGGSWGKGEEDDY